MTLKNKISALSQQIRHNNHVAMEEKAVDARWWDIVRKILPPTIKEHHDHLEMTDGTFMKCIILGVPKLDVPGYARSIDPAFIDDLLNAVQDQCYVGYSFKLTPFGQADSTRALEVAEFANIRDQLDEMDNSAIEHVRNKTRFVADDIREDQHAVHMQKTRQFYTSCVVTVRANSLEELDVAYSHVKNTLEKNMVGFVPAEGNMLEIYKSSQPWGDISPKTVVDALSNVVAALLPVTRLESRTDLEGIWFGNQRMANASDIGKPIIVDLSALSAAHGLIFGPTGSGKTALEMILGMRSHDQDNYRVVYITVKSDAGTQFRNVPQFYKGCGAVIDMGTGKDKSAINPLQIIFDEAMIDGTDEDYLRIYHRHKMIVAAFFDAYLKTGLSDNQAHYLDRSLNEIYAKYGLITLTRDKIVCHPDKWKDGSNFPTIHMLTKVWSDGMASGKLGRLHESAESLLNRTGNLTHIGAHAYINRQTNVDLSKDFIVVDLSGIDKGRMQDAMSVLVTSIISERFNTDAKRKTMLVIDEGVAFARNPERLSIIGDLYMMGRSQQVTALISFTQPTDMSPELAAMLQTNAMWAYVFGRGMGKESVRYVQDFFKLTDEEAVELSNSSIGEGLLILGNQTIPTQFKITDQEMRVLKGSNEPAEKASPGGAFMLLKQVTDLVLEHGISLDEWIENADPKTMKEEGYEPHLVQMVCGNGKAKAWISSDIIDGSIPNKKMVYNQTLDHYATVIQLAGYLLQNGFTEVEVNHFDKEDVRARLGDQEFSFEYERPGSHTKDQLEDKRIKLESTNSRCFFVCQKSYERFVSTAVGAANTYTRGSVLKAAIDAVLEEYNSSKMED